MIAKHYGVYDGVQEEYIQFFVAKNDEDAKRTAAMIVRQPNFNDVTFKDRSLHFLFDIDTATGVITDNSVRQIFLFATAIEQRKQEEMEKLIKEKIATDEFKQELKDFMLKSLEAEVHNEQKAS